MVTVRTAASMLLAVALLLSSWSPPPLSLSPLSSAGSVGGPLLASALVVTTINGTRLDCHAVTSGVHVGPQRFNISARAIWAEPQNGTDPLPLLASQQSCLAWWCAFAVLQGAI
jgi:hypothetical protein